MNLIDRLALANCAAFEEIQCSTPCHDCRQQAAAVTAEIATWLEERFGYSETADLLRSVMPEVEK